PRAPDCSPVELLPVPDVEPPRGGGFDRRVLFGHRASMAKASRRFAIMPGVSDAGATHKEVDRSEPAGGGIPGGLREQRLEPGPDLVEPDPGHGADPDR